MNLITSANVNHIRSGDLILANERQQRKLTEWVARVSRFLRTRHEIELINLYDKTHRSNPAEAYSFNWPMQHLTSNNDIFRYYQISSEEFTEWLLTQ